MLQLLCSRVLRNFSRNRFYTLINLAVLVTGISSCILIILYVNHQTDFDAFHKNADRIFRLTTQIRMGQSDGETPTTSVVLGPVLKQENDFVEDFVRVHPFNLESFRVEHKDQVASETGIYGAETSIFDVFTYPMLVGNPQTALKEPHSIVLTEDFARKYFQTSDCLGRELLIDYQSYNVTGVLENLPTNTDLQFQALLSHDFQDESDWNDMAYHTYVLLKGTDDHAKLGQALRKIEENYLKPYVKSVGMPMELNLFATPLPKVHFQQGLVMDTPKANYRYVYFFLVVGFFMLSIASFNYINLSAIQSFKRSKEIGVKKVQGAQRWQLVLQFICESLALTLISLSISLVSISVVLPGFNTLAQVNIAFANLFYWKTLIMIVVVVLVLGLISSIIPATYLTSFSVTKILKGKLPSFNRGLLFRALLVIQFAMSVVMMIYTFAVYRQMEYMKNKSLGFGMNQVVVIHLPDDMDFNKNKLLRKAFLEYNSLKRVSLVGEGSIPGSLAVEKEKVSATSEDGRDVSEFMNIIGVDENYFDALKIEIKKGRNFDPMQGDAKTAFIVNESFVRHMGWNDPVGRTIDLHGKGTIIGVVGDYHYRSLHNPIEPLVLHYNVGGPNNDLLLLISDISDLDLIKRVWSEHAEKRPLFFSFLDESFNKQYQQEESTMTLFSCLACLLLY